MGEKRSETFQKPQLITAMVHKHLERSTRLLNGLKNHRNQIFIFSHEKTFIEDPVFKKQNGRIVTFGNVVSEHRRVSIKKHPASIRMFDVVASNREKMPQAWFNGATGSAVHKEVLETVMEVLPRVKKITNAQPI